MLFEGKKPQFPLKNLSFFRLLFRSFQQVILQYVILFNYKISLRPLLNDFKIKKPLKIQELCHFVNLIMKI